MAREMKDSGVEWIGEIPENWECRSIKNSFSVYSGATPKSEVPEFWDGEIVWITPADFKTQDRTVSIGKRNLTKEGYSSCGTTLVPSGSVIFSKRAPIGTVAVADTELCTNQGCLSCVPHEDADAWFFYYTMSVFTEQFNLYGTGTTFKEISYSDFINFHLPTPPLPEQSRIAAFLDRRCAEIDRVMEQTRATIEEYKKLKQSIITEAVTHGTRGERKMKDSGVEWIGEIPEEWEIVKFKYIAQVKSNLVEPDGYGDYLQVSPENIEKGTGRLLPCRTVSEVGVISGNHLFHKGQILYSKIRPKLNKITIAPFDGLCSADMYPIETTQNIHYLLYAMLSDILLMQVSMITEDRVKMPKINQDELGNTWFVLAPSDEQNEIVDFLNHRGAEIDHLIDTKQQLLTQLESYKKSVIYEYVTGKKEVPHE